MSIWASQSIQFVWFLASTEGIQLDSVFQSLFNEEPSISQKNKVPNPNSPFLAFASGPFLNITVNLQLTPGRLDLVLQSAEAINENGLVIFPTEVALDSIYSSISLHQDTLPDAVRMAIVTTLVEPVDTVSESRKIITTLISLDPKLMNMTDIIFQLNREKVLRDEIKINRVLKWTSTVMQSFTMDVTGNSRMAALNQEYHSAVLTVDVNTVVGPKLFSGATQIPIWQQMIEETKKIGVSRVPSVLME